MKSTAKVIEEVASRSGLSKAQTKKCFDSFWEVIIEALQADEKIQLTGYGSFSVVSRSAREGRNPQTGELLSIPPAKVTKFKPGKRFTDVIKV